MPQDLPIPIAFVTTGSTISRNLRDYAASKMHDALNGFALTNAVFAFTESKLLDDLRADPAGSIDAVASATRHGYRPDQVLGLLRYLVTQDIFKERERFVLTPTGAAVFSRIALGRLRLYRGGYGKLMFAARELMEGSLHYGREISRDGQYVAVGSNGITSSLLDEVPLSIMEQFGARIVVDLGCGAAEFLIAHVARSSSHGAIGVDISEEAIAAGRTSVTQAGCADRVKLVVGDAFDARVLAKECAEADLFYSYAMEHELLRDGEQAVLDHINQMGATFPGKVYLLGEPMVNRTRDDGAFYWLHVLSKQGIPLNVTGWIALLGKLTQARLEGVFRPDHEVVAAYFVIRLGAR